MALNTPDAIYAQQFSLWQEVRATLAGKYAVIDIVTCLPAPQYKTFTSFLGMEGAKLSQARSCNALSTERIKAYWARGRFLGATAKTKEDLDGMIWSHPPEVELSNPLEYLEKSANGSGSGLNDVAQKITSEMISIGRYGVLVDMPSNESGLTQSQMQEPDKAPRMIQYKAEQIIFVKCGESSNSVDEIRLVEISEQRKEGSKFDWETVERIRRLVIIEGVYHNQLFSSKEEMLSDVVPVSNGGNMDYIPFQFFGADNNSPEYSKVPLYDLANLNLGHFVLDCDNRNNLHDYSQGALFVSTNMQPHEFAAANPNGLDLGLKGINMLDQGDSAEILQPKSGTVLAEALREDVQNMIMQGAQLVTNSSGNQTLGAKRIESNSSISTLKRISCNASSGIDQLLEWISLMLGATEVSTYTLNTKFMVDALTPEMIAQHIAIVQTGKLPSSTLYETARKAGFTNKSDEELMEEAEADNLSLPGMTEEQAINQAASE